MLTGIHTGQWGKEFGLTLLDLLKEIEKRTTIERYRLGSLNPTEITDELLDFCLNQINFVRISICHYNQLMIKLYAQ